MHVKLARKHGFCFGVEDAIELAETLLKQKGNENIVALGPVIHNKQVVAKLEQAGLNQSAELDSIPPGTSILIRSHGATPEVLQQAKERNLKIVDATCVLVKRAQNVVRQLHEEGYQVIMIGDRNHPEVQGVIGYAPNVIVVDHKEDLSALPKHGKLGVVAQTTHTPEHVGEIVGIMASMPYRELKVVNTLCLEVIRRQQAAVELAREVDVMFVLGGLHSANTRELARLCQEEGVETYHLETWEQFRPEMARGKSIAGVTAGASTPEWVIQEFVEKLQSVETP